MEYRVLGKTGLKVSEIGFGGEWLERHPKEESVALMKYAADKGINIIAGSEIQRYHRRSDEGKS